MLNIRHNLRGMTLVEIMVAMVIVVILFAAAAPSFSDWIQNTKIRTAAESVLNGLAIAKTEAVHRNAVTQFVSCSASSWDVLATSAAAASPVVCSAPANGVTGGWENVQHNSVQPGSTNAQVDASQATIGFNGLGRQVATADLVNGGTTVNPPIAVNIDVSSTLAGAACYCQAGTCGYVTVTPSPTGKLRCLRITVSPGGQVRMCDPALNAGTPQGC